MFSVTYSQVLFDIFVLCNFILWHKSRTSALAPIILSAQVRSHWQCWKKVAYFDFSAGAVKTVEKSSKEHWKPVLNGHHVVFVEEGMGTNEMVVNGCEQRITAEQMQ